MFYGFPTVEMFDVFEGEPPETSEIMRRANQRAERVSAAGKAAAIAKRVFGPEVGYLVASELRHGGGFEFLAEQDTRWWRLTQEVLAMGDPGGEEE